MYVWYSGEDVKELGSVQRTWDLPQFGSLSNLHVWIRICAILHAIVQEHLIWSCVCNWWQLFQSFWEGITDQLRPLWKTCKPYDWWKQAENPTKTEEGVNTIHQFAEARLSASLSAAFNYVAGAVCVGHRRPAFSRMAPPLHAVLDSTLTFARGDQKLFLSYYYLSCHS